MENKILTIYIPTYNRKELLRPMLYQVMEEMRPFCHEVELVIADNHSTDGTGEMVREVIEKPVREWGLDVRYHENSENIGSCRNFLQASDIVRGTFFFVLGDDDMLLKGGLSAVVELLREHGEETDYCLLNFAYVDIVERNRILAGEAGTEYEAPQEEWFFTEERRLWLDSWEDVYTLPCRHPCHIYTYLGSHLVRTAVWHQNRHVVDLDRKAFTGSNESENYYMTLDYVYPHIKIISHAVSAAKKRILFLGKPVIGLGVGAQTHPGDNTPLIEAFVLDEVYDYYKACGMKEEPLASFVEEHQTKSGKALAQLIASGTGRKDMITGFIKKHAAQDAFAEEFASCMLEYTVGQERRKYYDLADKFLGGMFVRWRDENKKVAIWGAGELTQSILTYCEGAKEAVVKIVDGAAYKWGTPLAGTDYVIAPPKDLEKDGVDVIIIASVKYAAEIKASVQSMGLICEVLAISEQAPQN